MATSYTVDRATHNHTRFTVTRIAAKTGNAQTLNVSYGKRGMTVKHDGEVVDATKHGKTYEGVAAAIAAYLVEAGVAIGSPTVKTAKPKAERQRKEQPAYKAIPYRELQRQLSAYRKDCRVDAMQVSVPLNSKHEALYDEYMRLGLGRNGNGVHYLNVAPKLGANHPTAGVGQLAKAA